MDGALDSARIKSANEIETSLRPSWACSIWIYRRSWRVQPSARRSIRCWDVNIQPGVFSLDSIDVGVEQRVLLSERDDALPHSGNHRQWLPRHDDVMNEWQPSLKQNSKSDNAEKIWLGWAVVLHSALTQVFFLFSSDKVVKLGSPHIWCMLSTWRVRLPFYSLGSFAYFCIKFH